MAAKAGSHLGFQDDFSYFWSTNHHKASYQVSSHWPFSSEEEAKNRFSRWPPWISDRDDFSYFLSISHPNASYQVWSQLAFGFRRSKTIDFQDGHHGGNLGFPIGMILTIFDLQVTLMLPTWIKVNKPFGFRRRSKNRFSRWPPWLRF